MPPQYSPCTQRPHITVQQRLQRRRHLACHASIDQPKATHIDHTRRRILAAGLSVGSLHAFAGRVLAAENVIAGSTSADVLKSLEERVTDFTLANGLRVLVLERRAAPIVSCMTYADVGAYQEVDGQTGIAHLLEHMAFKGTQRIGTRNYAAEEGLLEALDGAFYALRDAQAQDAPMTEVVRLAREFQQLQAEAEALSIPNAFGSKLQQAGAVGLNAVTSHDSTKYYLKLPANKLELWFAMEAERFRAPVFRELYSEKRVVAEERRLRVDAAPLGKFSEDFSRAALKNNYGRPVIGFEEDVDRIGRQEIEVFFRQYYTPSRLTLAVVGDVSPSKARQYAEKYFGGWRASNDVAVPNLRGDVARNMAATPVAGFSSGLGTDLPGDTARPAGALPAELRGSSAAGPLLFAAYYRPSVRTSLQKAVALDMISDLLSGGRTALLYSNLVQQGRALSASAVAAYPADRHPNLFFTYGVPSKGGNLKQLQADMMEQLSRVGSGQGIDAAALERIRKGNRVDLLNVLRSNSNMASVLCSYTALNGDWKTVINELQLVEDMQLSTLKTVAAETFRPDNMYLGYVDKA